MVSDVAASAFGEAARERHDRPLHLRGRTYRARLKVTGMTDVPEETGLLGRAGEHDAVARISKAVTGEGLPDVLGVALRVPYGGATLDLLFATTGWSPVARHVLVPRSSFLGGLYTTLLPYKIGGATRAIGLLPSPRWHLPARLDLLDDAVRTAPLTFALVTAPLLGRWEPCGLLRVIEPMAEEVPAFDPETNRLPDIHPTGPFQTFRSKAYRSSRENRGEPTTGT
ncbi:hypothetical protein [Bailinhaonella thermotolerans]|uniref:Phosphodiesterase n=1 Tax=Bailinhaonella thermotolerans TaxID=1070861 RepID=A0A3A4AFN2_9ACTN|nr:hypothetical protein [Bailinhaonella thermotolerans]RJL24443.1 hypothetical protein D5H75_29395 [Bailinhaonella thermotolerans]